MFCDVENVWYSPPMAKKGKKTPKKFKANQWHKDPRHIDFLAFYLDPTSETYAKPGASALKAHYSASYADNITSLMPDWLSGAIGRKERMLVKAEEVLEKSLNDKKTPGLAQNTAKFLAETIGKAKGYSKRTELTGKDGKDLTVNIVKYAE